MSFDPSSPYDCEAAHQRQEAAQDQAEGCRDYLEKLQDLARQISRLQSLLDFEGITGLSVHIEHRDEWLHHDWDDLSAEDIAAMDIDREISWLADRVLHGEVA